jgi:hypothetical protein
MWTTNAKLINASCKQMLAIEALQLYHPMLTRPTIVAVNTRHRWQKVTNYVVIYLILNTCGINFWALNPCRHNKTINNTNFETPKATMQLKLATTTGCLSLEKEPIWTFESSVSQLFELRRQKQYSVTVDGNKCHLLFVLIIWYTRCKSKKRKTCVVLCKILY